MTKLPEGQSRLQLIKEMAAKGQLQSVIPKQGRLVVPIDQLVPDPKNERKTFRNMAGLIASVQSVGLIEPITVTPLEDGRYQIRTGHRRWEAAKAAGLGKVEVLSRDPEDELRHRTKSLISNIQREDIGAVELAQALRSLMDDDLSIKTQDGLARTIGKDKTWVSRILRILTLPADLQRKVATSQLFIPYDAVTEIARLEDRELQAALVEELLNGATVRDIRERVKEVKPPKDSREKPVAKPKKVFHTSHGASVIVQSKTSKLPHEQVMEALAEAMEQARQEG
jgi:ParB family chromosome partitioning protein